MLRFSSIIVTFAFALCGPDTIADAAPFAFQFDLGTFEDPGFPDELDTPNASIKVTLIVDKEKVTPLADRDVPPNFFWHLRWPPNAAIGYATVTGASAGNGTYPIELAYNPNFWEFYRSGWDELAVWMPNLDFKFLDYKIHLYDMRSSLQIPGSPFDRIDFPTTFNASKVKSLTMDVEVEGRRNPLGFTYPKFSTLTFSGSFVPEPAGAITITLAVLAVATIRRNQRGCK